MLLRGELPETIAPGYRRSFNFYRAAFVHAAVENLRNAVRRLGDRVNPPSAMGAEQLMTRVERSMEILRDYPPGSRDLPSRWKRPAARRAAKSKNVGMSKLRAAWQLVLVSAFADDPEYREAVMVTALTGCRPAELQKGVQVRLTPRGTLLFGIMGAKVTEYSGQKLRMLEIRINNDVARDLAQAVIDKGIDGRLLVRIDDPRKFCDAVRTASRRVFPGLRYVVSPYTFRHAVSADLKKQGFSVETIARWLGHQSGISQRGYGKGRLSKLAFLCVVRAAATCPVRDTAPASWPKPECPSPDPQPRLGFSSMMGGAPRPDRDPVGPSEAGFLGRVAGSASA